jgi:hypothetical protein
MRFWGVLIIRLDLFVSELGGALRKTLDPSFRWDDSLRGVGLRTFVLVQTVIKPSLSYAGGWYDRFVFEQLLKRHHLHVMTAAWADRMRTEFPTRSRRKPGSSGVRRAPAAYCLNQ